METRVPDISNGYEEVAARLMAGRLNSRVGVDTVREWADAFPPGALILDLGCGHGVPISQALMERGFVLYGVDASTKMTKETTIALMLASCKADPEAR